MLRAILAATLSIATLGVASAADVQEEAEPKNYPGSTQPDKVVCKRLPVASSLFVTKKKCMTRREWDLVAGAARETTQDLVDRNRARAWAQ